MFNNDEPPVSLFSFQDIITSLTGIMIFFLLLFSLNILELTQQAQEESPVYQELAQINEKNKILKRQIADISSDIRTYRKRIKAARLKDEAALKIERYRFEEKINELKQEDLDRKLQVKKEKYTLLEKENSKLKQRQIQIEQEDEKLKKLAAEIEAGKKQIAEIRKAMEKRRKEVQITVDSSINKIPVLVELSVNEICIVNTKDKSKRIFPRKSPLISELVAEAVSHLRLFSPGRYYFVLMVKPSAADYIDFFLHRMLSEIKNASYGMEPILENEGVTNE